MVTVRKKKKIQGRFEGKGWTTLGSDETHLKVVETEAGGGGHLLQGRWFNELGAVFANILRKEWDVLRVCGPLVMKTLLFRQGLPPLG